MDITKKIKKLTPVRMKAKLNFYEVMVEGFHKNLLKMATDHPDDSDLIKANNKGLSMAAGYLRDRIDTINEIYPEK